MLPLTTVDDLRRFRSGLLGRVALIPTMGALHPGHLQHVEHARRQADHVIVSIFVNPTQFAPDEDFERYPRTLEEDLKKCDAAGVDAVFAPALEQMYPAGDLDAFVDVPFLTNVLEGAARPGHFAGVCRVVAKLLNMVRPDIATFGRKDYQQLRVIQAMVRDLAMPVRIIEVPTLREADGLAMSSRNRYLNPDQRKHAVGLFKALEQARTLVVSEGETDPHALERSMTHILAVHQLEPEYAVIRHPMTLAPLDCIEPRLTGGVAALVAAHLGDVRLIDNMLLGAKSTDE